MTIEEDIEMVKEGLAEGENWFEAERGYDEEKNAEARKWWHERSAALSRIEHFAYSNVAEERAKIDVLKALVTEVYELQAPIEAPPQAHMFLWDDWCRRARQTLEESSA
jgi:hypothetical protein